MQENNENMTNQTEESGFDLRTAVSYFLNNWKWFALSFFVCMVLATVYLRKSVPMYQVTAKILLQDKEKGSFSSQTDMLTDFGFEGVNSNVENEIEVINSMSVVRRAVVEAGLYISYKIPGFSEVHMSANQSPFRVSFSADSAQGLLAPLRLHFVMDGVAQSKVTYDYVNETKGVAVRGEAVAVNADTIVLKTVAGDVFIERNNAVALPSGELLVTVSPLAAAVSSYLGSLAVSPVSKTSSVAVMVVNTPVVESGMAFLDAVMESYNYVTNEDKRQIARKTEAFIIDRIDSLSVELEAMEVRLANYKKKNQLIDVKLDAPEISKNKSVYTKQLEEIDLLIKSSRYLNEFVNNPENDMKVIPTTFGLSVDQALVSLITNYNREVIERDEMARTVTEDNPSLVVATERVKTMQADLRSAIKAFDKSLSVQRKAIASLVDNYTNRFVMSPDIERELLTITRECDVKSGLYVMLLQKYEENALNLAVTADNLRCIDPPAGGSMVSPNKMKIYMVAIVAAFAIPALVIYLLVVMRTKISSVDEVQKKVKLPFVGSIPLAKYSKSHGGSSIVVEKDNNDLMAEAFRSLRTNLQFVMKKTTGKVVMFTSTTSGEGKTFVASNLAVSKALLGKKVLLVGLDIRKPRLAEMFGFDVKAEGITTYLAADAADIDILDKFIVPSGVVAGLDILAAGIVPPNPAELLSRNNLDKAIEYLSGKYDYIVLDTAPVGLVSDSFLVSRVADAVVYVLRVDYTQREDMGYLNSLVAESRLENVSYVVNGEKLTKKTYGYGGYGASGRRIGYGYAPQR